MNAAQLRKVKRADILKCSVGGREFFAEAGEVQKRDGENGVTVDPIPGKGSKISHRWVSGVDVTGHYARVVL